MKRGGLRPAVGNWLEIVEDYLQSGLSPSIYCRQKGLPVSTLSTWRKRYKEKVVGPTSGIFQKVKFSETVSSELSINISASSGISLQFANDINVSLARGFDAVSLKRVIKVFRDELC